METPPPIDWVTVVTGVLSAIGGSLLRPLVDFGKAKVGGDAVRHEVRSEGLDRRNAELQKENDRLRQEIAEEREKRTELLEKQSLAQRELGEAVGAYRVAKQYLESRINGAL